MVVCGIQINTKENQKWRDTERRPVDQLKAQCTVEKEEPCALENEAEADA